MLSLNPFKSCLLKKKQPVDTSVQGNTIQNTPEAYRNDLSDHNLERVVYDPTTNCQDGAGWNDHVDDQSQLEVIDVCLDQNQAAHGKHERSTQDNGHGHDGTLVNGLGYYDGMDVCHGQNYTVYAACEQVDTKDGVHDQNDKFQDARGEAAPVAGIQGYQHKFDSDKKDARKETPLPRLIPEQNDVLGKSNLETQKGCRLSLERFRNIPEGINHYTGFRNYAHFLYFFRCLGPATYHLNYKSTLTPENECFLTLIKLRKGSDNIDLGFLFDLPRLVVGKIFRTWISFMYLQLKELNLWIPKETIQNFMPSGFESLYPSTRVILDATEFPIDKPQNVKTQIGTWSSYKNKNTLKTMVGISPSGCVTYISPLYGGATSDRQIMERSSLLLAREFDNDDSIMADRGIMVQDLFANQNVLVNTPTMLKGKSQLDPHDVVKDRRCSSKRVHVERVIGLAKTNKILTKPLSHDLVKYADEIVFVCFVLCNFKPNLVGRNA